MVKNELESELQEERRATRIVEAVIKTWQSLCFLEAYLGWLDNMVEALEEQEMEQEMEQTRRKEEVTRRECGERVKPIQAMLVSTRVRGEV